jgi:hypothetical protein
VEAVRIAAVVEAVPIAAVVAEAHTAVAVGLMAVVVVPTKQFFEQGSPSGSFRAGFSFLRARLPWSVKTGSRVRFSPASFATGSLEIDAVSM